MNLSEPNELFGLLDSLCEETLTTERRERLQTLLREDAAARRLYIEYMTFSADLKRMLSTYPGRVAWQSGKTAGCGQDAPTYEGSDANAVLNREMSAASDPVDQAFWEVCARKEAVRAHAERLFEQFKTDEMRRQQESMYREFRARRRRLLVGAGSLVALLVLVICGQLLGPRSPQPEPMVATLPTPPPVLARIVRSLNARWQNPTLSTEPGTALRPSSVLLAEGLVELRFDEGTGVVVQAPAALHLEDAGQIFLRGGSVSVRVARGSSGFIVRTPTGTVVDYGTEFGVVVNAYGETEAFVYEGKIGLRSGSDPVRSLASRILTQGQAGAVDASGRIVDRDFQSRQVIREMPETSGFGIPGRRFDLADALAGGNGFGTADPNQKVDLRTASVSGLRHNDVNPPIVGIVRTPAPAMPFVDFLFIADGSAGPVPVSSTGQRFRACPDTDGNAFAYLTNGDFPRHIPGELMEQVLAGIRYGTRTKPAISMHANAGVTFDLQAIRAGMSGVRLVRFTGLCGISETAETTLRREGEYARRPQADFWVLVDGQVRFHRREMEVPSGAALVSVELQDDDRFLSLIVTDGGDGNSFDWGIFAEPSLQLTQEEQVQDGPGV